MAVKRDDLTLKITVDSKAGQKELKDTSYQTKLANKAMADLEAQMEKVAKAMNMGSGSLNDFARMAETVEKNIQASGTGLSYFDKSMDSVAKSAASTRDGIETAQVSIEDMNKAAGGTKNIERLAMTIEQSSEAANAMSVGADDATSALESLSKTRTGLEKLTSGVKTLHGDLVDLSSPESVSKMNKLLEIMRAMAFLRGEFKFAQDIKKGQEIMTKSAEALNGALAEQSEWLDKTAKRAAAFNTTLDIMERSLNVLALSSVIGLGVVLMEAKDELIGVTQAALSTNGALKIMFNPQDIANNVEGMVLATKRMFSAIKFSVVESATFFTSSFSEAFKEARSYQTGFGTSFVYAFKRTMEDAAEALKGIGPLISSSAKALFEAFSRPLTENAAIFKNLGTQYVDAFMVGFNRFKSRVEKGIKIMNEGAIAQGTKGIQGFFSTFSTGGAPKFIKFVDTLTAMPGIFGILGATLLKSENSFVKFLGVVSLVTATLTGGLALVVGLMIGKIAELSYAIGRKLTDAMDVWETKFQKAQETLQQFAFTIRGFTNEFGEGVIGTMSQWTQVMDEVNRSTTFNTQDIQKSVKLLIAEGANLGISFEQNMQLLRRASDIAANGQTSLVDATTALTQAFGNNGQALQAYGIYINEHSINHNELAKQIGRTREEMTQAEKIQVTYNEFMKQSAPLIGASVAATQTLAGATKVYDKNLEQLQINLGSQSRANVLYKQTLTELVSTLVQMPKPITDVIGTIIDFGGVALKIIGIIGAWTIPIMTLMSLHHAFSFALAKFSVVQKVVAYSTNLITTALAGNTASGAAATGMFNRLTASLVANTTVATTATAVYANFARILGATMIAVLQGIVFAVWSVIKAIGAMTLAVLKNPLFWKAAAIATLIYGLVNALKEMKEEIFGVSEAAVVGAKSVDMYADIVKVVMDAANDTSRVLTDVLKMALSGVGQAALLAALGWLHFEKAITRSPEKIYLLEKSIEKVEIGIGKLQMTGEKAGESLAAVLSGTAYAADAMGSAMDKAGKKAEGMKGAIDRLLVTSNGINRAGIRTSVLGDEYDKLTVSLEEAKKKAADAAKEYKRGGDNAKEALDNYRSGLEDTARIEAEMAKLRRDSFLKVTEQAAQMNIDLLKASGQNVEAIRAEFVEKKRTLEEQIKLAQKAGNTEAGKLEQLIGLRKQLSALEGAAIDKQKADDMEEALKPAKQALDNMRQNMAGLNTEILTATNSEADMVRMAAATQIAQIDGVKKAYEAVGPLSEEIRRELSRAEKITKEAERIKLLKTPEKDGTYRALEEGGQSIATKLTGAFQTGTLGMVMGFAKGAEMIVDAAKAIVDFIPGFINKIADFFKALTDFPKAMMDAFSNLGQVLTDFIKTFPAQLVKMVEMIPIIVLEFIEALPDIVGEMISGFVSAIMKLVDRLPDIIERFVSAFIAAIPEIAIKFIEGIIANFPKIAFAFIKLWFMLPIIFWKGVIKAIKSIGKAIGNFFSNLFGKAKMPKVEIGTKSIENFGKKLTDETGKIFSVKTLSKPAGEFMNKIGDYAKNAMKKGANWIKEAWMWVWKKILEPIYNLILKAWNWVNDNIIQPIVSVIIGAWQWVKTNIIDPIVSVVRTAWQFVVDIWNGLASIVKTAFGWIKDLWDGLGNIVEGAFGWIRSVFQAFGDMWATVKGWFKPIAQAFSDVFETLKRWFEPVVDALKAIIQPFIDAWNAISGKNGGFKIGGSVGSAWEKGKDWFGLAAGGMVQSLNTTMRSGADTVPHLLQPGEFVMSKPSVDAIGPRVLGMMNQTGRMPSQGGTGTSVVNIELTINSTGQMTDKMIREKIVPTLKEELKKASQKGEFLISKRGVQ